MQEIEFFLLLSLPVVLGGAILFFAFRKKRRLSPNDARFFLWKVNELAGKPASDRIIGCDKILDHALAKLAYHGTFAEKLKARPQMLEPYYEEIWRLHKLRNRLVHELTNPSGQIERDAGKYERVLRDLFWG